MTSDADLDELKVSALHLSELNAEGRRHLSEQHSASFKWLSASLLAMNGAGLIALKDINFSDATFALVSGTAFYLGMVLALLIGFLGQKSNQRMLDPVARSSLYWRRVAHSGELDEVVQDDIEVRMSTAMKFARWPSRAGFASLTCFSLGLGMIALCWPNK